MRMKLLACLIGAATLGGGVASAQTLESANRTCVYSIQLKNDALNRDRLAQCKAIADQLVTAATPPPTPPPQLSMYGPQSNILCPLGAELVLANADLQTAVNSFPTNTSFCLAAGVHNVTSSVTPKTGNTFTGEYGAILDGTGWVTADNSQAAFRANNQDIDDVWIRNLTFRAFPQKAIHSLASGGVDRWIVEYVDVGNTRLGIELGNGTLRHAYVHDNTVGGLTAYKSVGAIVEDSELTRNGNETKFVGTKNLTFRRNYVHNNINGFWADTSNIGAIVENNVVEDSSGNGIEFEISGRDALGANGANIVRSNTVRRSTGGACVFISTSANTEVHSNICENNFRGIQFFLNTAATQWLASPRTQDLRDNYVHDNTVRVGPESGAWANALSHSSTTLDMTPYLNGSMNNKFENNSYVVPNLVTPYWRWGTASSKTWTQWQVLPQDATGTVAVP